MNQLPGPKAGGEHGACHAPVVFAFAFGLVNGAGAGKNTRHVRAKAQRAEAAKHVATAAGGTGRLLAFEQSMFARHRQARQRCARRHLGGINAGQQGGKSAAVVLGVGHLHWQGRQEGGFTFGRRAVFERVKKCVVHG